MSEQAKPLPLVLIGPMGAGKTKIGRRVARSLSVPFIDTDKRIVADHGPITEIFASHGEPEFRRLERIAVADALKEPAVVSLGGGAVIDPDTQRDLDGLTVVLLTVTAEAVAARIRTDKRPLLKDGTGDWQRIYEDRRPTYERLATITFDTSREPIENIADRIADWAKGHA